MKHSILAAAPLFLCGTALAQQEFQPRMGEPLPGLSPSELNQFVVGLSEFNKPLSQADGLGPVFNKESCGNCHNNPLGGPGSQTVTRFGRDDKGVFLTLRAQRRSSCKPIPSSMAGTCARRFATARSWTRLSGRRQTGISATEN